MNVSDSSFEITQASKLRGRYNRDSRKLNKDIVVDADGFNGGLRFRVIMYVGEKRAGRGGPQKSFEESLQQLGWNL